MLKGAPVGREIWVCVFCMKSDLYGLYDYIFYLINRILHAFRRQQKVQ